MKTIKTILATALLAISIQANASITNVPNILSAPMVLYDEGGNPLADGDYLVTITLKDYSGNTLYEEEQEIAVVNHVAPITIGQGYAVGSDLSSPAGGLSVDTFDVSGDVTVEIYVEGLQTAQEVAVLTSQPYAFISDRALSVADDAVTTNSIRDGTITANDLEESFLKSLQNATVTTSSGETLTAKSISVSSDIGLNNSGSTTVQGVLQDLDSAITSVKNLNISELKEDVSNVGSDVDSLEGALNTHLADTDNPHNVTYSQTGAASATDLNNHINNTSNPHHVTYSQTGAASATDLNNHINNTSNPHHVTYSQTGAASATDFDNHVNNTSNPHSVTYSQTGAAAADHNHDDTYVKKGGDTMEGDLDMGSHSITNVNEVDGVDVSALEDQINDHETRITALESTTSENEPQSYTFAFGTATIDYVDGRVDTCSGTNIDESVANKCQFQSGTTDTNYVVVLTPSSINSCGYGTGGGALTVYSYEKATDSFNIWAECDDGGLPSGLSVDFVVFWNET